MKASTPEEDKFDREGKISAVCRPLISDQRDKLLQILADKKALKESKKLNFGTNHQNELHLNTANFLDPHLQRSMSQIMQLQSEIDASPTVKAKPRIMKKNEILELCEQQFHIEDKVKQNMYNRAFRMYEQTKNREGFIKRDVLKPEHLSHFHIEAFGDDIEVNRYEDKS